MLASVLGLGVITLTGKVLASAKRVSYRPYAVIRPDGEVRANNLSEDEVDALVVSVAMLLNYDNYVLVSSFPVYCSCEDVASRIYVYEGADEYFLEAERIRLEVEIHNSLTQPRIQYYL